VPEEEAEAKEEEEEKEDEVEEGGGGEGDVEKEFAAGRLRPMILGVVLASAEGGEEETPRGVNAVGRGVAGGNERGDAAGDRGVAGEATLQEIRAAGDRRVVCLGRQRRRRWDEGGAETEAGDVGEQIEPQLSLYFVYLTL
jgi:hypothetical protein